MTKTISKEQTTKKYLSLVAKIEQNLSAMRDARKEYDDLIRDVEYAISELEGVVESDIADSDINYSRPLYAGSVSDVLDDLAPVKEHFDGEFEECIDRVMECQGLDPKGWKKGFSKIADNLLFLLDEYVYPEIERRER